MKKTYKILLFISNLCLLILILNVFVGFIIFPKPYLNTVLIICFALANIVIALKASFDAANSTKND